MSNVVLSRMVDMQVDEGLPVYVVPDWPLERIKKQRQTKRRLPSERSLAVLGL